MLGGWLEGVVDFSCLFLGGCEDVKGRKPAAVPDDTVVVWRIESITALIG